MMAMIDAKREGRKPPNPAPRSKENAFDLASVLRKSGANEGINRPTKSARKSA